MLQFRAVIALFLMGAPALLYAQEKAGPCRNDVREYCAQAKGNPQDVQNCLLDHQKDISDACYGALKHRLENQNGLSACKQDSEKLCQGVQKGGGRIVTCLLDHQKELSDNCYDALAKRGQSRDHEKQD